MAQPKVVRCSVLFDCESGTNLYGFYTNESFDRHMAEWNDPENATCMAFEVNTEVGRYIRDHLMTDESRTDEYVTNELED